MLDQIRMNCISSVYLFFFSFIWFIGTGIETFHCNNGQVISDGYFCDLGKDCSDGSDEGYGCSRARCGIGSFFCADQSACKDISVRCDRVNNCLDGSDELNCVKYSKDWSQETCPLSSGKYLCRDKLKCLDLKNMCDGICNCDDCSDENSFNCYNYNDSCRLCPYRCLLTPDGPQCVCNTSMKNESSKDSWCENTKYINCTGDDSCDQHCMRYNSSTTWCSCFENYTPVPESNGRECQTNVFSGNLLVFSTYASMKVLNITSDQTQIIKTDEVNLTALTTARNHTYYANFQDGKAAIFKITDPSEGIHKIFETDSPITSLAVDWITKNIYFINNECLSVCTNNGNICTQMERSGVSHVVLAPTFGWMFYAKKSINEDEKIIMKSNMDGTNKIMFIDGSFHSPISLSIDEMRETLYWFESTTETLYSVKLQGSKMKEALMNNHQFSLSFTVNDGTIFYLKSENHHKNTIYSMRVERSFRFHDYKDFTTNGIKHLYAYNPFLQDITKSANPCATQTCNGLCLLRPFSTAIRSNYTCLCQNHTVSQNGTSWCTLPSAQPDN